MEYYLLGNYKYTTEELIILCVTIPLGFLIFCCILICCCICCCKKKKKDKEEKEDDEKIEKPVFKNAPVTSTSALNDHQTTEKKN